MNDAPILAIAGTLCDARLFAELADNLEMRLICADPIEDADLAAASARVLAVAPARFVVMGFSLGGFVALDLLRRAPDRLAGAILISSNARADPVDNAAGRRAQLELARREGMAALIDRLWPGYVAPGAIVRGDLKHCLVAMADSVGIERFAAQTHLAMTRPDSRADLAGFDTPLLIIHGAADALCPADRQHEIVAAAPDATLASIDGAGHFVPLERPDRVAAAINAWRHALVAV